MLKPRYPSLTIMVLTQILSYFQVFSLSFLTSYTGSMIFLKQQYCKCLPQPCLDSSKESCCLSHSSGGALDLLRSTLWRAHLYTYTNRISKILRKYGYLMINFWNVYLVWFSSTFRGEVAKRRSHIWMTGIRSSSEARTSWVATSGFQAKSEQCI